ncbi:MAG TPA: hypothetical protein VJK72_01900 [Candidatus Nanoarchaeia archaeon]|nr:hypothetical protein [Candidatus Nanoarchaeia archaeon]
MQFIFANGNHGNAPVVMAVGISQLIASQNAAATGEDWQIIVPEIYGREGKILAEEQLLDRRVVIDRELGRLLKQLFYTGGDFNDQMDALIANRASVEKAVREHLDKMYGKMGLEVNCGAYVTADCENYFVFPTTHTKLYQRTLQTPELMQRFDMSKLERLTEMMSEVDNRFEKIFIPEYNPYSFDKKQRTGEKEISTPPLARHQPRNNDEIPKGLIYCMLPGTGAEYDAILRKAHGYREAGRPVAVQKWHTGPEFEGFLKLHPQVISNPNVERVISRAGWGTIWLCQVTGKELEHVPYSLYEPEVYFNAKTLNEVPMRDATLNQLVKFNTLDGIAYVAKNIIKDM